MSSTVSETIQSLLSGEEVCWEKFQSYRAGGLKLETPGARRLLGYLLTNDSKKVAEGHDSLFDGLISVWSNESYDPALVASSSPSADAGPSWRLHKLETFGFGGLNIHNGPNFELDIDCENWCLEGQNGSGKTSIVSAVIWALTGFRCNDQNGLAKENGQRRPVLNSSGNKIGDWPTITAYPCTAAEIGGTAETWVRLTFRDDRGETAEAYRFIQAAKNSDPEEVVNIDPRIIVAPQLIEVGLLMPARLPKICFGDRSESLYEAVKLLTGFDQLADVAEGASNFTHSSKRFKKYARDKGIERIQTELDNSLGRAEEKASEAGIELKIPTLYRETKDIEKNHEYVDKLNNKAKEISCQAATCLRVLSAEIASSLDINNANDRFTLRQAVAAARIQLQDIAKNSKVFLAWKEIKKLQNSPEAADLVSSLDGAWESLGQAISWHERQQKDQKLRLKALASRFYQTPSHSHDDPECPLCEGKLSDDKKHALARELEELRHHADAAERNLSDVCLEIEERVKSKIPTGLLIHLDLLSESQPKQLFRDEVVKIFSHSDSFSSTLTGVATFVESEAESICSKLPYFSPPNIQPTLRLPDKAQGLGAFLIKVGRTAALVDWWETHGDQFRSAWTTLKGSSTASDFQSASGVEKKLCELETALSQATPLDEVANALNNAAERAGEYIEIQKQQLIREEICEALKPLKDLRTFVDRETSNSIHSLSSRMKEILSNIHFQERLKFENAELGKKSVRISGSFDPELHIDAASVANTSWLRAMLWAFIVALREEALANWDVNPFPLMILDDPQVTFDPRNKRKWAAFFAEKGNKDRIDKDAAQLIVITHERQFFQMLVNAEKLGGNQGLVFPVCDASKVAVIIHGTVLSRKFNEAITSNNDEIGHDYVMAVRNYCEDLLKIMLKGEGPDISGMTLEKLVHRLKERYEGCVAPFVNPSFLKLLNLFNGGGHKGLRLINEAHHKFDGTIGVAQARDVKAFWDDQLHGLIHNCFKIQAEYEAYVGEPRLFPWMDNTVDLPIKKRPEIKGITLLHTGIAAAAKTDGRAGDGLIMIDDLSESQKITLFSHDVCQLAAGTLDPVADLGDVIIVKSFGEINDRNLVVTAFEDKLLVRRYNTAEVHPHIAVLTGQSTDPFSLVRPVIVPKERISAVKIVGTLFLKSKLPVPPKDESREFVPLDDLTVVIKAITNAKLFKVEGRSAEPIALDGQFIITQQMTLNSHTFTSLDGRPVIAVDENGALYFKRIRKKGNLIVLESLNPDGLNSSEVLTLDGALSIPRLTAILEVVGVLFELPEQK